MDISPLDNETAKVMQIAIAPVFLISGVGVVLGSMTTRYGRVIDRVRAVLREATANKVTDLDDPIIEELRGLYTRAKLVRTAIIFASGSIFCAALTIFFLFAKMMFRWDVPWAPEALFVLSLLFLTVSIALFIEDFALSLKVLKLEVTSRLKKDILPE